MHAEHVGHRVDECRPASREAEVDELLGPEARRRRRAPTIEVAGEAVAREQRRAADPRRLPVPAEDARRIERASGPCSVEVIEDACGSSPPCDWTDPCPSSFMPSRRSVLTTKSIGHLTDFLPCAETAVGGVGRSRRARRSRAPARSMSKSVSKPESSTTSSTKPVTDGSCGGRSTRRAGARAARHRVLARRVSRVLEDDVDDGVDLRRALAVRRREVRAAGAEAARWSCRSPSGPRSGSYVLVEVVVGRRRGTARRLSS